MDLTGRPGFLRNFKGSKEEKDYEVQGKYIYHTTEEKQDICPVEAFFSTSNSRDLGVEESRDNVDKAVRRSGGTRETSDLLHQDISRTTLGHGFPEMQEGLLTQAGYYNPGALPLTQRHYPESAQSALIESNDATVEALDKDPPINDLEDAFERDLEIRRRGRRAAEGVRITRPW